MDIYGTCLWHLKKKIELSYLGKELEQSHRCSPETWYPIIIIDVYHVLGVLLETFSRKS